MAHEAGASHIFRNPIKFLTAAGMVAWEFDIAAGKIVYASDADAEAEAIRMFLDDRTIVGEVVDAVRGAGRYRVESRVVRPDGGVTWIENQGEVIRDTNGRPILVIGIAQDVTPQKNADECLRNVVAGVSAATGEAFFRVLAQHLCLALKTEFACIGELHGDNRATVRTIAMFEGDNFSQGFEYALAGTPCSEAISSGRCSYPNGVQSYFPADVLLADMRIISYVGVALKDSTGEPIGVMSVMSRFPLKDVDAAETILSIFASRASAELERRRSELARGRAEAGLQESRLFSQRIAETTPNVLFVFDLIERRNVYASDRSADIIGYTPQEIAEMGDAFITRLMHPDDLALLPAINKEYETRRDGEVFEHIFRFRHKNGQWRWVHRNATIFSRMPDGRPKQIVGAVTDITEFKEAERELRELSVRLLNAQDAERRRIARELHDVTGQNLAVLGLHLDALLKSGGIESRISNLLSECHNLCRKSQNEIRTLSYLLHPPELDMFGLVRALGWYVEGFEKRTGINVRFDANPDIGRLPRELETDLFRVVQEALTNVMRHSGSEDVVIRLEKNETCLILEIEDSGRGLQAENLGVDKQRQDVVLGVGIPGMRERLRQYGGSLEIRSEGRGTLLRSVVPLSRASGIT